MDVKDLKFVRLTRAENARLIPKYLIEQDKDKDFTTEQFFKVAPFMVSEPSNIIGVFVNEANAVKGFMWVTIGVLTERLYVSLISFDEEYQEGATEYAIETLREERQGHNVKNFLKAVGVNLKDAIWLVTEHPKEYKDWQRAKQVLIETLLEIKSD